VNKLTALVVLAVLSGCVSAPKVVVQPQIDEYGATECVVNDEIYPLTEDERRTQIQLIVNEYCPVN